MSPLQALEFAKQSDGLSVRLRDRSAEAWAQYYIGRAHLGLGDYASAQDALQKSVKIRDELGQPYLSMEPIAAMVETALQLHDTPEATHLVEKIFGYLASGGSLEGTDEPLRVYYVCYQFLKEQQDPRAQQILRTANEMLEAQVSKFKDEDTRTKFVESFPWRRAIRDASKN
jgi:tetratricopeptide (TPR) repeat protein